LEALKISLILLVGEDRSSLGERNLLCQLHPRFAAAIALQ